MPTLNHIYVSFLDVCYFSSGSHDGIDKKQRNIQPENQVLTRKVDKEEKEKVMCKITQNICEKCVVCGFQNIIFM